MTRGCKQSPGPGGCTDSFSSPLAGFIEVGGLEGLQAKYFGAIPSIRQENSSCGLPRPDAFHIFRDPVSSDLPWPGVLVGMTIPSLWYWCTDQVGPTANLGAATSPGLTF